MHRSRKGHLSEIASHGLRRNDNVVSCLGDLTHYLCIVLRGSIDEQVKCSGDVIVLGALLPQVSHVFFQTRSSQRVLGELTRVDYVVFRYCESVLSLLVLQLVKRLIGLSLHIER